MISITNHISQKFDQNLSKLYTKLNELVSLIISAMQDIKLFVDTLGDAKALAPKVLKEAEQKVNQMLLIEVSIDEECERILALYQPVASDLRTVIAIIRVLGEIQAIVNSLQQMLKLVSKFNQRNEQQNGKKPVQIIGADKLGYLAGQTGLLIESAMQLMMHHDAGQNQSILKQYKVTKQGYKRLTKLLDNSDTVEGKTPIHNFRFAQEFLRIINHVKLIIGHFIYLNEGRDVRHLSFKQMREIMELSLDHD